MFFKAGQKKESLTFPDLPSTAFSSYRLAPAYVCFIFQRHGSERSKRVLDRPSKYLHLSVKTKTSSLIIPSLITQGWANELPFGCEPALHLLHFRALILSFSSLPNSIFLSFHTIHSNRCSATTKAGQDDETWKMIEWNPESSTWTN